MMGVLRCALTFGGDLVCDFDGFTQIGHFGDFGNDLNEPDDTLTIDDDHGPRQDAFFGNEKSQSLAGLLLIEVRKKYEII